MVPIRFALAQPTVLLNVWQRMHWREQEKHQLALSWDVRAAIGGARHHPIDRCVIAVERRSVRVPDWDGLYGGLKPLLDTLQVPQQMVGKKQRITRHAYGLGVIANDSPSCILRLLADPVRVAHKADEGTSVAIIPITNEAGEQWVQSLSWRSGPLGEIAPKKNVT